jgi:endo-1,4-beta-xylanase
VVESTATFPDVPPTNPFRAEITWAAEAGVVSGFVDGTYGPGLPVSRQVLAALLHQLAGAPTGPFPDPGFSDVPAGHPFEDEIAWAGDVGILGGYGDGTFRPSAPVSRQALAATLSRLPGAPSVSPGDPPFTDVPTSHPFFAEISWAWSTRIVEGFDDGTFRPTHLVSRQAITAMLYRTTLAVPFGS